jgi:site-specific DNA-methyltransferase (adenine-specific)
MGKPDINIVQGDCMDYLPEYEDNHFDLAIVDPPYFEDVGKKIFPGNKVSTTGIKRNRYESIYWNVPGKEYFDELFRVSKNQIIWGCNYYAKHIPHVSRIIWDKKNDSSTFSKAEIASKSFNIGVDIFRYTWNGMIQENMKNKETRIHPTQKPVDLYKWLLYNYAKEGDKILDTHLGSGSIAIACYDYGYDLTGFEIDKDYYDAAVKRFKLHTAQQKLF